MISHQFSLGKKKSSLKPTFLVLVQYRYDRQIRAQFLVQNWNTHPILLFSAMRKHSAITRHTPVCKKKYGVWSVSCFLYNWSALVLKFFISFWSAQFLFHPTPYHYLLNGNQFYCKNINSRHHISYFFSYCLTFLLYVFSPCFYIFSLIVSALTFVDIDWFSINFLTYSWTFFIIIYFLFQIHHNFHNHLSWIHSASSFSCLRLRRI